MNPLRILTSFWLLAVTAAAGADEKKACCHAPETLQQVEAQKKSLEIPDITVSDQDGHERKLFSDLIEGKVVAISFIFTTCTTICPPIGANFARLEKELGDRAGSEIQLLSISVDPVIDTPQRLRAWRAKLQGGSGWTLVTGVKTEVDKALKAMQFLTADKTDHSPFLLLGNQKTGNWRRVNGFTEPKKLAGLLDELSREHEHFEGEVQKTESSPPSPAQKYFTDVHLLDQNGVEHRLYTDLMRGKVVVMQSFFASCKTVCPVTVKSFAEIQKHLGDRLGREVVMLSISVDPANDTPERLRTFADQWKALPGWYFLTGETGKVRTALKKFGQLVEDRESHSNVFILGNESTGLWKKVFGLADTASILTALDSVIEDSQVAATVTPN